MAFVVCSSFLFGRSDGSVKGENGEEVVLFLVCVRYEWCEG